MTGQTPITFDDVERAAERRTDPEIVAGRGTLGLEVAEQVLDIDTAVLPIGGGGLIGGVATALTGALPDLRVVGVQAESAATVPTSLQKGLPHTLEEYRTIADGIATGDISELTCELIEDHVDEVVTVTDDEIAAACLLLLERAKQLVEGAGAAPVAAILDDALDVSGETVVPVLSGGNLDMRLLRTVLTHELPARKQLLKLRVCIVDEPGKMAEISGIIADHGATSGPSSTRGPTSDSGSARRRWSSSWTPAVKGTPAASARQSRTRVYAAERVN